MAFSQWAEQNTAAAASKNAEREVEVRKRTKFLHPHSERLHLFLFSLHMNVPATYPAYLGNPRPIPLRFQVENDVFV